MDAHLRQEAQLSRVREARTAVAGSKARVEAQAADVRSKLPQLEEQARLALVSGREDLARFALQLRLAASEHLQTLEQQVLDLDKEERTLSLVEQRLSSEIEALRARQEVIEARYTTAEAHVRLYESSAVSRTGYRTLARLSNAWSSVLRACRRGRRLSIGSSHREPWICRPYPGSGRRASAPL